MRIINCVLMMLFIATGPRVVSAFELLTTEQYDKHGPDSGNFVEEIDQSTRSIAIDKPVIQLVQPESIDSKEIRAPMDIELRFKSAPDAVIDLETLRFTIFLLDVTDRLLANAEIQEDKIIARNAEIPAGKYTITVSVRDSKKRKAKKKFKFRVVD